MATKKISEEKYNSFIGTADETSDIKICWCKEFLHCNFDDGDHEYLGLLAGLQCIGNFVLNEIEDGGYIPPFMALDEAVNRFRTIRNNGTDLREALRLALSAVAQCPESVTVAMNGYDEGTQRSAEIEKKWA